MDNKAFNKIHFFPVFKGHRAADRWSVKLPTMCPIRGQGICSLINNNFTGSSDYIAVNLNTGFIVNVSQMPWVFENNKNNTNHIKTVPSTVLSVFRLSGLFPPYNHLMMWAVLLTHLQMRNLRWRGVYLSWSKSWNCVGNLNPNQGNLHI